MGASLKFLFYFGLLSAFQYTTAQTSLIDRLHEMQQNPILKEKVYVHTNKTSYFPDDVIWFKAYVGDSINDPSVQSKILEVKLFNYEGTQLFDRKISIKAGTGAGQIELNDAIPPGIYFLQARTNYMRNFGVEYQYLQEITILGQIPPNISMEEHKKYDVQLLPESGNLIEDVENIIGIKAMLNGRGVDFQGTIFNNKGDTITTFQSEHEGMGKCSFVYKKRETYRAKIKIQDTLIEQAVPAAITKGVSLSVDNSDEEFLQVSLKVNEATFYNQVYSNYTLLYHQDRQLFQLYSIDRLDSLSSSIKTKKNIFLDGVHSITLFANNQPIAQRKFYIETDRKKALVSLEKSRIETDSITYRVLSKGKKKNLQADLSISILQGNSKAVNLKNTIESAFFLDPYIKGYIENPAYYFDTENEKRKQHLDLLLITQGWTGFTLDEMIEDINPIENYEFKTGFDLKGEIKQEAKHQKVVLIPDNFNIIDKVALQEKSKFVFQDLSIFKGDTVRVAYQNWLGKIIKPLTIEYDTTYNKNTSKLLIPERFENLTSKKNTTNIFERTKKYGATLTGTDTLLGNLDGTIDLDEVTVTDKKLSERFLQRRKTIEKYEPLVSDIGKYYDLPLPDVSNNSNISLLDFLARQGFTLQTSNSGQSYLGSKRKFAPLFINGRPIQPGELPNLQLQIKDIENIMVNNLGNKGSSYKSAGVNVSIFQVFTSNAFNKNKLFDKFVIKNGFDRAKKYYTPMYIIDQSRPIDLLEVDWKPHLKTDKKGNINFRIAKDERANGLLFVIQGFSNEGHLISKSILTD